MKSNGKKARVFMIIMELVLQGVLVFPWYQISGQRYSVLSLFTKFAFSGNWAESMEHLIVFNESVFNYYGDKQSLMEAIILLSIYIGLGVLIWLFSFMDLVFMLLKRRIALLNLATLVVALGMGFLMSMQGVFLYWFYNFIPVIIIIITIIKFVGEKGILAWEDINAEHAELRERDMNAKRERKRRLAFPGRFTELFFEIMRKNFRANSRDYILLLFAGGTASAFLFLGVGTSQMLSPLDVQGSFTKGHGVNAVLLTYLGVCFVLFVFLLVSVISAYLRKRARNNGMFLNLGMRKRTLRQMMGVEIGVAFLVAQISGMMVGSVLFFLLREIFSWMIPTKNQFGQLSFLTYLVTSLLTAAVFGVSLMMVRDFFGGFDVERSRYRQEEKEKMPGKFRVFFFVAGIVLFVFSLFHYARRENAEGIWSFALISAGVFLCVRNGWCILLLYNRKYRLKKYYDNLAKNRSLYYRYRTTFRYVFFLGVIHVAVLFLFSKEFLSSMYTEQQEELFPYDYMCMSTEADDEFFQGLEEKYSIESDTYPMVRVTNLDNTERRENQRVETAPQGQHIGISVSTYKQLCEKTGQAAEKLALPDDGSEFYTIYQQDKSIKAHPIDFYSLGHTKSYLRIGAPLPDYSYMPHDNRFLMKKETGEKIGVLTGAYRRGYLENILVFSDSYFDSIQNLWKTCDYGSGWTEENFDSPEQMDIYEWPTKLRLLKVDASVKKDVERELQIFRKAHKLDESYDAEVQAYYSSDIQMMQIRAEHLMGISANAFVICVLTLLSILILYLKLESEINEKKSRNEFLRRMGMRRGDRVKVLRSEIKVYFACPAAIAVLLVPVLTKTVWRLREYSTEDCVFYAKGLVLLAAVYIILQLLAEKMFEIYMIRKVEGTYEKNHSGH